MDKKHGFTRLTLAEFEQWIRAQQVTRTDPDGSIVTGRPLSYTPACIKGNNANAMYIERMGNVDAGRDTMKTKSRPGTAFVGSNTVANAQRALYPAVRAAMPGGAVPPAAPGGMTSAVVTASALNVRSGPGKDRPRASAWVARGVTRTIFARCD